VSAVQQKGAYLPQAATGAVSDAPQAVTQAPCVLRPPPQPTGLDDTRAAFGPCTAPGVPAATCSVLFTKDIATEDGVLDTGDFHGTNVAGVIVGVAPGAKLVGLDVFDADGTGSWSTLIAAFDWAVQNKAKYNITAANLSLGGGMYASE
jgi:hypothetical protein